MALVHWKVLLVLVGFIIVYVGVMFLFAMTNIGGGIGSGFLMMLSGAAIQILLLPVFLAAVAGTAVVRSPIDFSRAFDNFGYLLLAGFTGWIFSILLSLLPLVGLIFKSETVGMVISGIPVCLAVLSPGTGLGTIIGASISLLIDGWLFLVLLILATYLLQWVCIFAAMSVAKLVGEESPAEDLPPGPAFTFTTWTLQPLGAAFPVFSLMHWIVANYLAK